MSAAETIKTLEALGGSVTLEGERLRCRVPAGNPHIREYLQQHRGPILHLLRMRQATSPGKPSWADGPRCPGCKGTWHSEQHLHAHMRLCRFVKESE